MMNEEDRKQANVFIMEYIARKQAQGQWDPTPIGLMRVAYGGACEVKNAEIAKLTLEVENLRADIARIYDAQNG